MSGSHRGPDGLLTRLTEAIGAWPAQDHFGSDEAFNDWALETHRHQVDRSPVLKRFWEARGALDPAHWTDVPPVPVAAFKSVGLGPDRPEAVFRTSGTTGGPGGRGVHRVASLALYRGAVLGQARRCLLTGSSPVRLLALVPDPLAVPDSSLARMAGFIAGEPGVGPVTWGWDPAAGVRMGRCGEALGSGDAPLLILTTAFALALLFDGMGDEGYELPAGSGVMETGGFKGKALAIGRPELYAAVRGRLGVDAPWVVGEYGMTELLSQSYDGVMGSAAPLPDRVHGFPPWVRTRVLDPVSLEPVGPGRPGLLAHYDLACAGSVCHILTEDMGTAAPDGGFRLSGRATGAEVRGCSLLAESFLRAVGPLASATG